MDFREQTDLNTTIMAGQESALDGKLYIIDPQREARHTQKMGANYNIYFGIPHENGADWRYWSPDTEANAERDALFKSVMDPRVDPGAPVGPGSDYDPNPDPGSDPDAETVTLQNEDYRQWNGNL